MGLANVVSLERPLTEPAATAKLTPSVIRQRLKELPAGHLGQSTRQLYLLARQVNQAPLDVTDRFQILQMLDPHIDEAIRALRRKLVHLAFPLDDRDIRIIELANAILQSAVAGYRQILDEGRTTHWLLQPLRREMWVASLHRLLHDYSWVLSNQRLLNQAAPRGVWQNIHQLYRSAAEARWHRIPIAGSHHEGTLTIEQAYKQILLNSLLSYHQLRFEQIDEVVPLLPHFAEYLVLRAASATTDRTAVLCISRGQDSGPLPAHACNGMEQDSMLVLDTAALSDELRHHLESGKQRIQVGQHTIRRETVKSLLRLWCETDAPVNDVAASTTCVEVILGLKTIHQQLLNTIPAPERPASTECPVEPQLRDSPVLAPLCKQCTGRSGGERLCECIDIQLDATRQEETPWRSTTPKQEQQRPIPASVRELAPDRHELTLPALQEAGLLSYGGVIGIRRETNQGWDVGQVTDLRIETDRSMKLQFATLISEALAVTTHIERPGLPALSLYGLIGTGAEGELILLLPYRPITDSAIFAIEYQAFHARLQVTGNRCITPSVMAFTVEEYEVTAAMPPLVMTQTASASGPAQPNVIPSVETDRYAALWNTL